LLTSWLKLSPSVNDINESGSLLTSWLKLSPSVNDINESGSSSIDLLNFSPKTIDLRFLSKISSFVSSLKLAPNERLMRLAKVKSGIIGDFVKL
jgi:hypothetical protein